MISLEEATAIIENHQRVTGTEIIQLSSAHLRILAEDIVSDRDLPPFNKAAMDGYACRREELGKPLRVNESIPAGAVPRMVVDHGTCTRIMTGAKVPEGADCVVKQEETSILEDGSVIYQGKGTGNNICHRGEDVRTGSVMLRLGSILHPQNMGIAASAGVKHIKVFSRINVGIISTGSELVEPGEAPGETSILNSNACQLMGQIESSGNHPVYYGIVRDDPVQILSRIEEALKTCDIVVLTGGASVGEFDLVNGVLDSLGFSVKFQKLAIQPGKPVSFASKGDKICFGLSGNPVSCFLQFELLVKSLLHRSIGSDYKPIIVKARLSAPFQRKKTERIYFLPVRTTVEGEVAPLDYHGSAHLTAIADLNGFAQIPSGVGHINSGEEVYVRFI